MGIAIIGHFGGTEKINDGQKEYADQVDVDAYLTEFVTWFSNNTTGTCSR